MNKTISVCDVCKTDLREETNLDLTGKLMEHDPADPSKHRGKSVDLEDLCEPCSIDISEAIDKVITRRGQNEL